MGDCTELISYLLLNGAKVDDQDQNKRTSLSRAAEFGALGTVKILFANGAKVNTMDDMYLTPLSWLVREGNENRQMMATKLT